MSGYRSRLAQDDSFAVVVNEWLGLWTHAMFVVAQSKKSASKRTHVCTFAGKYTVGTPAEQHVCGQTIQSETITKGIIYSPTYPGMYPDNIFCFYKIQGQAGQRIKFTFLDLDVYEGGTQ